MTITFSEAVSGLTREALTAPNGTLSELITTDGGITWTGTYTPNADVTDATNQLVLNQTWVRDAAGNTGQGLVSSGNFTIDTQHPQPVSLTLNAGGEAQTLSYQLEMSEGVSGLSVADFSLLTTGSLNATLTSVTAIDATHWQIQLTNVTGNGTLQLRYNASASLATDAAGNGVGSDISNASYSNSTPQTRGLNDALATQQQPFSLTLPAGAFSDADSADALSYSATLADGSALPGWLSFDPATRTLSGTPTLAGSITVRITATDHFGESVSSSFTLRTADFLNGDPQFRSEQRHSAVDSGQNASYSREQLTLLGLAQGDGSPQESGSLFTPQGTPAGDAPSITAAFSSGQQGGDGSGSSTLAGVFSQNGVNHYQPVDGRSHGSDVNGDMSGRSSLAAQFAIPSLPGATGLEVFSGSSWQQVSDNTINQTVQPTSVFGTPLFSQQLSQPEAERTEQIAALESALRDITPQA
ncbi:hypothetical protein ASF13_21535 [Erwinia sp. Leaf53]|nr:hypothetical protein ASF13_21535 [Erwinia sp. Leaf53]